MLRKALILTALLSFSAAGWAADTALERRVSQMLLCSGDWLWLPTDKELYLVPKGDIARIRLAGKTATVVLKDGLKLRVSKLDLRALRACLSN